MTSPKAPTDQQIGEAQRTSNALAEAAAQADARQMDELPIDGKDWGGATVNGQPVGGVFIVNGVRVGPDGTSLPTRK